MKPIMCPITGIIGWTRGGSRGSLEATQWEIPMAAVQSSAKSRTRVLLSMVLCSVENKEMGRKTTKLMIASPFYPCFSQ